MSVRIEPKENAGQFCTPSAHQTGNTEHLPAMQGKRNVANNPGLRHIAHFEKRLPLRWRAYLQMVKHRTFAT